MVGGTAIRRTAGLCTDSEVRVLLIAALLGLGLTLSACGGSTESSTGDGAADSSSENEDADDDSDDSDDEAPQSDSDPAEDPADNQVDDDDAEEVDTSEDQQEPESTDDDSTEDSEDSGDSDDSTDDSEEEAEEPESDNSDGDEQQDEDQQDDDQQGDDDESAAASTWLRTSKRGDGGEHVEALQARLNELGLSAGQPDGDYGRKTERAVRGFQRLIRVEPTGRADRITLNYLDDYSYDGPVVTPDSSKADVEGLQERLAAGPFDPGKPDGEYGTATTQAVCALEKLADIPVDGVWGPLDEWAMAELEGGRLGGPVRSNDQRWVEVDLSQQLMKVYDPGSNIPVLVSHASSGSGIPWENEEHSGSSVTPRGDFAIQRRISGWRESSLDIGRLYNPLYFVGGIAFHGATSVPLYPASHGCIRLPMHIADYLPGELPNGTPVHVMA